jgi:hypothetical protein
MNTNDVTNLVTAINESGGHVTNAQLYLTGVVVGFVVHLLHQTAAAWSAVGGWRGFKNWFSTGKSNPPENPAQQGK